MRKLALLALLFTGCFQHRFGYLVQDPDEVPRLSPAEVESRRSLMEVGTQIGVLAGIWQQEDYECYIGFAQQDEEGDSKYAAMSCRLPGKPGDHEFIIFFERKGEWLPIQSFK